MALRIVKAACNRKVVHIGRAHRGHLTALYIADFARGVEHKYLDPLKASNRADRGRARVPAGRANDGELLAPALQEGLEQAGPAFAARRL